MPAAWAALAEGVLGAVSSGMASNEQANATDRATQLQRDMYNQTRTDNLPALDARNASLTRLQELLGVGGDAKSKGYGSMGGPLDAGDVQNEAGYKFGMDQGMNTLNNQLASRGMRNSGAALMAANRFGTDYATTKYDDAFNREQTQRQVQLNPLQSLAGLGQTGATTMANAGASYANHAGEDMIGGANARAASYNAIGNQMSGAANQLGGWYMSQNRYNPYSQPGYGQGYNGTSVNQGNSGGDPGGSFWGIE